MEEEYLPNKKKKSRKNIESKIAPTGIMLEEKNSKVRGVSTLERRRRQKRKSHNLFASQQSQFDSKKNSMKAENRSQSQNFPRHKTFSSIKGELEEITKPLKKTTSNFADEDSNNSLKKKGILKNEKNVEVPDKKRKTLHHGIRFSEFNQILKNDAMKSHQLFTNELKTEEKPNLLKKKSFENQDFHAKRMELMNRAHNIGPKYLKKLDQQVKIFREEFMNEIGFDFEKKLNDIYQFMKKSQSEQIRIPTDILHDMINDTFRSILLKDIWRMVIINQEIIISRTLEKEMDEELKQIQQEMNDHIAEIQTFEAQRELQKKFRAVWKVFYDFIGLQLVSANNLLVEKNKIMAHFLIKEQYSVKCRMTIYDDGSIIVNRADLVCLKRSMPILDSENYYQDSYTLYHQDYRARNILNDRETRQKLIKGFVEQELKSTKRYHLYNFLNRVCNFIELISTMINQLHEIRINHNVQEISFDSNQNILNIFVSNQFNSRVLSKYELAIYNQKGFEEFTPQNIRHIYYDGMTGMAVNQKDDLTERVSELSPKQKKNGERFIKINFRKEFLENIQLRWNSKINNSKERSDLVAYIAFMDSWDFRMLKDGFGNNIKSKLEFKGSKLKNNNLVTIRGG